MTDKEIIKIICSHFNISLFDIFSKKRNSKFVITRMFIYFYLYKELKYSYSNIAKMFSYDHATIINGIKNIENICDYNDSYKEKINEIFSIFNKEPFFKEVLDVEFYRNFIKKIGRAHV